MSSRIQDGSEGVSHPAEAEDILQQVLIRLTRPQLKELEGELLRLREQIDALKKLEGDTAELQKRLQDVGAMIRLIEQKFLQLGQELRDPVKIEQRLDTTILPALNRQVKNRGEDVAEVLAPVMGPAIRHQIRDAREDIIDALYPLIGQIIGKAISEALRELTRNIDSRLRQQLNFRDRIRQTSARLRGVSEAEFMLRGALPYSIERVFLVHRETGLLLSHIATEAENRSNMDMISGMLTAIQDFVRDSFNGGEGNLEEITHGGRRILLEGGQYAYVAVVLSGVEPVGFNNLIRDTINDIHVRYESTLKHFDGNMQKLPDFSPVLRPLLSPASIPSTEAAPGRPLSRPQKRALGFGIFGFLVLIGLLIFACIFVVKLWPLAFPGAVAAPTMTVSPLPAATATLQPTPTPTLLPTLTSTPFPTKTQTPPPSSTPPPIGMLTGSLNVRLEPSSGSPAIGLLTAGEKVIISGHQGNWYFVAWPVDGEPTLQGWINGGSFFELPAAFVP